MLFTLFNLSIENTVVLQTHIIAKNKQFFTLKITVMKVNKHRVEKKQTFNI